MSNCLLQERVYPAIRVEKIAAQGRSDISVSSLTERSVEAMQTDLMRYGASDNPRC
jgi:hypothetical protein